MRLIEVWNEANLEWCWPGANAHDDAIMLAVAALEIREADPDAVVVMSGLSVVEEPALSFTGFFETLSERDVLSCIDVANVHPYLFSNAMPGALDERYLGELHETLSAIDDTPPPLWLTEFGYIVDEWASEDETALALEQMFAKRADGSFDAFFWFALFDYADEAYGLLDGARRPRAAFDVFVDALQARG